MASRQDQLHSYQFLVQRVVSALVMRQTDPAQPPLGRAAGATLAGVLVAAIALGAVAVYGLVVGGGDAGWRDSGAVLVEKESGARYVYRDGKLHPVRNFASALLIADSAEPRTVLVSRAALAGVPRGIPLGIADAPDSLPVPQRLVADGWTVCSMSAADAARSAGLPAPGGPGPRSALLVGAADPGGTALAGAGVLARHPDGSLHLIWDGRRHPVRNPRLVLAALTWTSHRPTETAPALLNALPVGADLGRVAVPGRGERSTVDGAGVGEVFMVESQGGGRQYAVATRDGLATITELQADLILTDLGQDAPTPLSQNRFAGLRKVGDLVPPGPTALPASTPDLVPAGSGAVCGRVRDDGAGFELRTGADVPDLTGAVPGPGGAADHVWVQPGRGAVVEAVPAPGASGGAISIVTDLGRRHPVTSAEVLRRLGYGGVTPARLPAGLVALVPAGRALDPEAALAPAVPG
ncbi:type VII secretion protein EccB [Solwaraspora sp. WMMD1047]|uniref:type VII secretion protein EccB n=1 Tax=Solwaraspora sp. WMMD1047 TaxID=3016102 RepID=UPI002415F22A|nr:type VII secretion protein EccB [Solwaraspora sp. WMMD1047]MDG4833887.1 type VII secretion protein EccB [Solwaraspora sp. WMMD1047]